MPRRVVPIGQCPALTDEPGAQVIAAGATHRDDPAVAVDVALLASHGLLPDVIGQRDRRLPSASQVCRDSGASIPNSRMRWPWISMVSPSMTEARPVRSAALVQIGEQSKIAMAKGTVRPILWILLHDVTAL